MGPTHEDLVVFSNGTFGIVASLDECDMIQSAISRKATYAEIQAWVRTTYGVHVTNLDISRAKKRCGLAQHEYKGRTASPDYYDPKPRPHKEALIFEAFKHFGITA